MDHSGFVILACVLSWLTQSAIASFQSVPELEASMYKTVDGSACVRLLTLSGEIGCANPDRDKVLAPILRLRSASDTIDQISSVLLPFSELNAFLMRTLNEAAINAKVAGVLVESSSAVGASFPSSLSDDEKFPEAQFAPYQNTSHVWNPPGSGIINKRFNFPVYLLSDESTRIVQEAALGNQRRNFNYPMNVAEFDLVMQTTKVGTSTSEACLSASSCLPLGGYSVWSSLPPISSSSSKEIVLVITSMDSASIFRDTTLGADSPLSGLVALLASLDALANISSPENWNRQLVVAVFTGEAWGYLGSRQFLNQLSSGGSSVQGLDQSRIYQILEVGSVAQAMDNVFYAHFQNEGSAATVEILEALQVAATSLNSASAEVLVNNASDTNPGIPPSSLMPFVHANKSMSGVILTEFNSVYMNKYYHSSMDISGQINTSTIAVAASLVARTLYILASGQSNITSSVADLLTVNESLIEQLVSCLLTCNPGMSCDLVSGFITPSQTCPNHYVGVFTGDPSESPITENIDDTARFIWNFLANRTALTINGTDTGAIMDCSTGCSDSDQVCVGSTVEHKGVCVHSTTRYVPAYSTRLHYTASGWQTLPPSSTDVLGNVDPVYTESYWRVLGVRIFMKESSAFDTWILIMGMAITVVSFMTILSMKSAFKKRLKHA